MNRGQRIAYAIAQANQTPASIARMIGCTSAAVYQWIKGDTKDIKNDYLFALADATGFEARWIAIGKGPETKAAGERERRLLDTYALLDERGRAAVHRVAEAECAYVTEPECKDGDHCPPKAA